MGALGTALFAHSNGSGWIFVCDRSRMLKLTLAVVCLADELMAAFSDPVTDEWR